MEKHVVKRADYPDLSDLHANFQEQFHILSQQLAQAQYEYSLEAKKTLRAEGKGEGLVENWPNNPPVPPETPKLESDVDIWAQLDDVVANPDTGSQAETEGPLGTPKESPSPPAVRNPNRPEIGRPLIIVVPGAGQGVVTVTPELFAKYEAFEKAEQALEDLDTTSQTQRQSRGDEYIDREIGSMGDRGWILAGFITLLDSYGPPLDFLVFAKSDVRNTEPLEYERLEGTEVIARLEGLRQEIAQKLNPSADPSEAAQELVHKEITRQRQRLMEEALTSCILEKEKSGWYSSQMLANALLFIRNVGHC